MTNQRGLYMLSLCMTNLRGLYVEFVSDWSERALC